MKLSLGKDEVPGSNPGISAKDQSVMTDLWFFEAIYHKKHKGLLLQFSFCNRRPLFCYPLSEGDVPFQFVSSAAPAAADSTVPSSATWQIST